eukprot:scpid83643/ scgid20935/ 
MQSCITRVDMSRLVVSICPACGGGHEEHSTGQKERHASCGGPCASDSTSAVQSIHGSTPQMHRESLHGAVPERPFPYFIGQDQEVGLLRLPGQNGVDGPCPWH